MFSSVQLFINPFTPQNIHHHLNKSTYYIAGSLHQCIYSVQDVPDYGSLYLVFIQSQPLTLFLHCNTCHMERLDHFFNLPCIYLASPLVGLVIGFSNSCK